MADLFLYGAALGAGVIAGAYLTESCVICVKKLIGKFICIG